MLNLGLVDLICTEIQRRHRNGIIKNLPSFGIVTNGTIASDETLPIFKKHNISPTVSLDGPKPVTDYLRGKGTYDRVARFIAKLKEQEIDYGFEATFTSYHLDSGMNLCGLLDFFVDTFDKHEMHIPEVGVPAGHPLGLTEKQAEEIYRDGVAYSIRNLREGTTPFLSFATRIMNVFLDRQPIRVTCPAGLGTLSVDTE